MIVDNREKFNKQRKQYDEFDVEKMKNFCKFLLIYFPIFVDVFSSFFFFLLLNSSYNPEFR